MADVDIDALRLEVVGRFRTIHAFCRAHQRLNRSTVYMVLAGRYPGNIDRQAERIRGALDETTQEEMAFEAIKSAACARCDVTHACSRCDALFHAQAQAAIKIFSG